MRFFPNVTVSLFVKTWNIKKRTYVTKRNLIYISAMYKNSLQKSVAADKIVLVEIQPILVSPV